MKKIEVLTLWVATITMLSFVFAGCTGDADNEAEKETVDKSTDDFVVAASGLNIFYRGIDNPCEICVSGYPEEKVQTNVSEGAKLVEQDGKYIVKITSPDIRKVSIGVTVDTGEGSKNLGKKEFRVLNVPTPMAKLNGAYSEGQVHKEDVMNGVLMANLGRTFFPFKVEFKVISFSFSYKVKGQKTQHHIEGCELSQDAKDAIEILESGTQVSFENIKVKGPSGVVQTAPITLELK